MTEITFHFNAADRTSYACRLLDELLKKGGPVVVCAPAPLLDRFDRQLWTFDPEAFVPHQRADRADAVPEPLQASTVWLLEDARLATRHETLLNLHDRTPPGFESFARVVEVVSQEADDRAAARERWKHYASRGYLIARREVAA
ncbi:DNA polymerase III subunit chi [Piscinibacter koreensis]|uniref:DNA polymerase III subunit chi n=1 Tax=Piscinibacter koreensis TaxID=2742824 RepID=A0A7Y6NS39_9BURK|nr:DNA polymerase III subunit chi [Schlegelella koreensis]NUZ08274.1 DNA polymerase III subunit chi [Schlegelella koreensis]